MAGKYFPHCLSFLYSDNCFFCYKEAFQFHVTILVTSWGCLLCHSNPSRSLCLCLQLEVFSPSGPEASQFPFSLSGLLSILHWRLDRLRCADIGPSSTGTNPVPIALFVKQTVLSACFIQLCRKTDKHHWVYLGFSTAPFWFPYLFCSQSYWAVIMSTTTFLTFLESGNFLLSCDHFMRQAL